MTNHSDVTKFLFGFLGMIFLGLSFLAAIGFYHTEFTNGKNVADTGYVAGKN